jgi:hypothetical protein
VFADVNDNFPAMWHNLNKAKIVWGNISRPLINTGVSPHIQGHFYKCMTGQTAFFGSKTWNVTKPIDQALGNWHVKATHRISGKQAHHQNGDGSGRPKLKLSRLWGCVL